MNNRIKLLRSVLGLTQQKFADRLGVKGNTISQYESGRNAPVDSVVSLICLEFNVSETWLRTGEGEMFVQKSRDKEIEDFVDSILQGTPDFRRKFISVLARMTPDEWRILEAKVLELADEVRAAASTAEEDANIALEKEADQVAANAREQFLAQKRRELQAQSATKGSSVPTFASTSQKMTGEELHAELDRQLLVEKERQEKSQASQDSKSNGTKLA